MIRLTVKQDTRAKMPLPEISPPLLNSASPWATTAKDIQTLFDCPNTGAVTLRTSLLKAFEHDDSIHQYTFFDSHAHSIKPSHTTDGEIPDQFSGSLNTLGYSPIPLSTYLSIIAKVATDSTLPEPVRSKKPFIVSVTGSAEAVLECYRRISATQTNHSNPLCMEVNLSCPNIPGKPPPAYSRSSLSEYLRLLTREKSDTHSSVPIGIKTPPYTYHDQFKTLIDALLDSSDPVCPVDFITATNTLGSSLVLGDTEGAPAINSASGAGIGGMAGAPLHPLALGNVRTIRTMLEQHDQLKGLAIIGVGGVSHKAGCDRMRAVGANLVAVGTALGKEGVTVFDKILNGK